MLNIITIAVIAINIVNFVNCFENYNEYLGSLTTTTEAKIFSILYPWDGVKAGQADHHPDDDGDTDDYNHQQIAEANNFRKYLFTSSKEEKKNVVVNKDKKDSKEKDLKRVRRASKRTIGSILRARGKTTPGTEFSSEEADGNKKGGETAETKKDEIKDYYDKGSKDLSKERKNKGARKEMSVSVEKKDSERIDEKSLLPTLEDNKKNTESSNIFDAIRDRNDKLRKEFKAREEDERNRIARAEAIKKAEEEEAEKRSAYMLDSDAKSNNKGEKASVEKTRSMKPNRKQVVKKSYDLSKLKIETSKKSKKDTHTDKYASLNSGESLKKNKKIMTKQNSNPVNRRMAHRKFRRSNAEDDRRSDNNNVRRVNYSQKARENLEAYRIQYEPAASNDRKENPLLADLEQTVGDLASKMKQKPEAQAPAEAALENRAEKKDPILITVAGLTSHMNHKPGAQAPAVAVSEDRKKADLIKTVGDIKRKPEAQASADANFDDKIEKNNPILADNNSRSRRVNYSQKARENLEAYKIQNEPVASNDRKEDPLLADLKQTVVALESQIIHKPKLKAPAVAILEDLKKDDIKLKPEAQTAALDASEDIKMDPILANLKKKVGDIKRKPEDQAPAEAASENRIGQKDQILAYPKQTVGVFASQIKYKPEAQKLTVAESRNGPEGPHLINSRRRRGREIFQIPYNAVMDNDYTMYDNDQDYEDSRRNLQKPEPQNVDVQVSIDTIRTPNQTTPLPKQGSEDHSVEKEMKKLHKVPIENKPESIKMLISTNLTSNTQDDKLKDDVAEVASIKKSLESENNLFESPIDNDISTVVTTELLTTAAAVHKKKVKVPESYKSAMKLYGPMIAGSKHRNHKGKKHHIPKTDTADSKIVGNDDAAKTLIGPLLSSKLLQNAPIRNNINIENLYVLGSEFIKIKGKPKSKDQKVKKRSSCHRSIKKPVEITIYVETIKDGVANIVEPVINDQGSKQVGLVEKKIPGSGEVYNDHDPNHGSAQISDNGGTEDNLNSEYPPFGGGVDKSKSAGLVKSNGDCEITKDGNWAKLVSKLSDSGFLNIAADYTPQKFVPNAYSKSDSDADALHKDSSCGEYECIKKHKKHPKISTAAEPIDPNDNSRRHHSHARHRHNRHGLRINIPENIHSKQSRFIKEQNNNYDALTDMVIDYGKFLQSFPINKEKKVPKKNDPKPQNGKEKTETVKMKSYIKELKSAFQKHFHGLVQYDWLGTAVDTQSTLMKLLGLTIQVATNNKIHKRDLTLLNYVKFLFESAVREFPDYIIENTLQAYMPNEVIEEAADLTEKPTKDKKQRAQSEEMFETPNSKFLFREYYIPESYRRDDEPLFLNHFGMKQEGKNTNIEDRTIIDTRFKEFLIETQSNLAGLYVLLAITPNEPNPDDWVTMIRTLFITMNFHQRLKYAQILLHIFAADLFNNIEDLLNHPHLSLYDILRDNAIQVKDNVNDMILILKVLTYIRLI